MPLAAVLAILSIGAAAEARTAAGVLDVPYLPQTRALCGGAAAAMVFRYWGDRHASIEQFAALVDRQAGGIVNDVLVQAIRERRWQATPLTGRIEALRRELARGHPIILMIEDRPRQYHYVVAVGADADRVFVHDPSWGPSRSLTLAAFTSAWAPTGFWGLIVLPPDVSQSSGDDGPTAERRMSPADVEPERSHDSPAAAPDSGTGAARAPSSCDRLLQDAVTDIRRRGLDDADDVLSRVMAACPSESGPPAELAGVRFAEERWSDATVLASRAVALDPSNRYAWDVLGSSRFLMDDADGALDAWNHIGKPLIDRVAIDGLSHDRYAFVANALPLAPNTLLTGERLRLAERRLMAFPDRLVARIGYRPDADGFATVDVTMVERSSLPRGPMEWAAAGAEVLVNREITAKIPGWTGQGEVWTGSWRWWNGRPRAAMSFEAPVNGALPGVWRVDAAWEAQTYAAFAASPIVREQRTRVGLSLDRWASSSMRYELSAASDSWNDRGRTIAMGGMFEQHLFGDRVVAAARAQHWAPLAGGDAFSWGSLRGGFRSSADTRGLVVLADGGVEGATAAAPLALWSGAGEGLARDPLLRAHPLIQGGVVTGPVFGRRMTYANVEGERWLDRPSLARVAIALFADTARAADRLAPQSGDPFQIDTGIGIRLRAPGGLGTLRIDYAHGMRDGSNAVTLGWQR